MINSLCGSDFSSPGDTYCYEKLTDVALDFNNWNQCATGCNGYFCTFTRDEYLFADGFFLTTNAFLNITNFGDNMEIKNQFKEVRLSTDILTTPHQTSASFQIIPNESNKTTNEIGNFMPDSNIVVDECQGTGSTPNYQYSKLMHLHTPIRKRHRYLQSKGQTPLPLTL